MRIQLCLAISGREEKAREEAAEVQRRLEALGHEVINPFELCWSFEGLKNNSESAPDRYWWECIKRCGDSLVNGNIDVLALIDESLKGAIYTSVGMAIEVNIAIRCGISRVNQWGITENANDAYADIIAVLRDIALKNWQIGGVK